MNKIIQETNDFIKFVFDESLPALLKLFGSILLVASVIFIFVKGKDILEISAKINSIDSSLLSPINNSFASLASEVKELRKEVSKFNLILDSVSETSTSTSPNASKKMIVIKLGQTVTVYPDFTDFLNKTTEKKKRR